VTLSIITEGSGLGSNFRACVICFKGYYSSFYKCLSGRQSQDIHVLTNVAYLQDPKVRLAPADALNIAMNLATGLESIHAANVVHRSLRPDNVIILKRRGRLPLRAKIVDLGNSRVCPAGGVLSINNDRRSMGRYLLSFSMKSF
jgi:serine/threonine protein kinase